MEYAVSKIIPMLFFLVIIKNCNAASLSKAVKFQIVPPYLNKF